MYLQKKLHLVLYIDINYNRSIANGELADHRLTAGPRQRRWVVKKINNRIYKNLIKNILSFKESWQSGRMRRS